MKSNKPIITRTPAELAAVLGLSEIDAVVMEVRSGLNDRIIQIAQRSGLTHAQIAKAARTSRTRITGILNRNTHEVSTDLLLRIVAALGYRAKITLTRSKRAA
jgi:predicted XRE-type DNA-binding protein